MRKLRLNAEDLTVDSFQTATAGQGMGTVRGAAYAIGGQVREPIWTQPIEETAATCQTLCGQNTCDGTCGVSCYTCNDPSCDSCHATGCRTGVSPQCCA